MSTMNMGGGFGGGDRQLPNGAGNKPDAAQTGSTSAEDDSDASDKSIGGRPSFGGRGDKGGFPSNKPNTSTDSSSNVKSNLIMIGSSFVILVVALAIAKIYR